RIQRTLSGDPVELGRTHALLGALANSVGKRTDALAHLNTALKIFEQYDQKRGIAHVSCNLGYVHLKKAEYELAMASLQRSLSLAERLGDAPLASVVFSNLGELVATSGGSGDLEEAEQWYKKSLALAKRFNDREYMSRWNAGLAAVLQEQGKHDEAVACIRRALGIGRAMRNSPCIGVALLALANLRVAQAQAFSKQLPKARTRLLMHAKEDIQRVLALEGLEAETRTRSQLTLAQISFLMGAIKKAKALAEQVIDEAQRHELASVEEKARRLLKEQLIY
ncbi:MAG TPA: tetratricopeptide repeat protein, partial [Ktedonobacteraceae bacterium]|nr:tetratricopeptide repeat protein [Ktedonobacteraceae bacterium]